MFCAKCGKEQDAPAKFCRKCGHDLDHGALISTPPDSLRAAQTPRKMAAVRTADPDELIGDGIGGVIMGDGFFITAIILGFMPSSVSSPLWLLLLIPAFLFFGKGFANVLQAKQIRRRQKQQELVASSAQVALPPPQVSFIEALAQTVSGDLRGTLQPSEKTTRHLG